MGSMKKPKKPEETARERSLAQRQDRALDDERDKELRRRRIILQGRLGTRQLLTGSAAGIMSGGPGGGGSPSGGRGGAGRTGGGTTPGTARSPGVSPRVMGGSNQFTNPFAPGTTTGDLR